MAPADRLQLFNTLSALTPPEFSQLVFALKPPPGIVPGPVAPQGDRVTALLNWVESYTGIGLEAVQASLQRLTTLPLPPPPCPHNLPRSGAVKFVGRDEDLAQLHDQLQQADRLAITAIRGMGGIGKTELALQYAYAQLQQRTYPGGLCWLSAKEQNIGTEIVNFATDQLQLAVPTDIDLARQAQFCWRHWPATGAVLVVIDDVSGPDDIAAYQAIQPYLPPPDGRFWVLLTTRLQLGASIQPFEIAVLSAAASLALLASLIGAERLAAERDTAQALCEWLGYLPLGLELVGRFLQRKPQWTLAQMQARLEAKRLEARPLRQVRPDMTADHESVAAAFELSWQDLDAPVRELAYRLCLYALAPIPWGWLAAWDEDTDADDLEDWRDDGLINRSLLTWVGADTVQLHQLIREFFRHKLETWPEADGLKRGYGQRLVHIAQQIPQTPTRDQILALTPAIPHLAEAATTWQRWLADDDEALLWPFVGLARFYEGQGDYGQAEPWFRDCLDMTRDRFGDAHPDVATSLNNLAELYRSQGRYEDAEPLLQAALTMCKALLGDAHPHVAASLYNLAGLYQFQGRYEDAEPLLQAALTMRKALLGDAHPDVAQSLNNLAALYESQGRYEAAAPLYQEALTMYKALLGDAHPDVAQSLNNLALLYQSQGRYEAAEPLLQAALTMRKALLGDAHPHVAASLYNLAGLYQFQGRYEDAEPLLQAALTMRKALLGDAHPDVAQSLNNLAALYESQGRYEAAAPLYQEALTMYKALLGESHPDVATSLNNLALLYQSQGRYEAAEPLYQAALTMRQALLGDAHPDVANSLINLAALYREQGRYEAAEPLFQEALTMYKALLGESHPDVATSLNNLALLYQSQGRYEAAEPLLQAALTMRKVLLGNAHPDVASSLNNLAELYRSQGRYEAAAPLYQEALTMCKALLGDAHPDVATSLNNLALLYQSQGRYEAAEPLAVQALQISMQALGEAHPDVGIRLGNLASLRVAQGNFDDVETLFLQALNIFINAVGQEHPYTQETINRLANLIAQVLQSGQADRLSDHPFTQAILQQLQQA